MGREKSKPVGCLGGMPMQLAGFGFILSIVLQLDNSFWPWDNDTGILVCLELSPSRSKKLIDQIFSEIKRSVVPIRPDRTLPRPQSVRRMKHYHNQKCNA